MTPGMAFHLSMIFNAFFFMPTERLLDSGVCALVSGAVCTLLSCLVILVFLVLSSWCTRVVHGVNKGVVHGEDAASDSGVFWNCSGRDGLSSS